MRLASARDGKGMTQDQVAERFGVNKATVSAWETGRGVPDALRLRALAKLYDVSADSLLWEDSLSPDAMKFAAAFDGLNEQQKRQLFAMWEAYIREGASDAEVEKKMPATTGPKYTPRVKEAFHPANAEERERAEEGGED
uniref:Transcriptional regulator, XRE family n=1 Tax=Variovorax paradoxus (strain S110) TaxID=543728 RepID=C5CJM4_VARPS